MNEQEKVIRRGEMWYIADPTNPNLGRPGVVLSNEKGCIHAPDIAVVFATTNTVIAKNRENVRLTTPRRDSVARCGSVSPVPRNRFQYKMCDLTPREMLEIEEAIHWALDFEKHEARGESEVIRERDFYKTLYFEVLRELAKKQIAEELPIMVELEREAAQQEPEIIEVVEEMVEALVEDEIEVEEEPVPVEESDFDDEDDKWDGVAISLLKPEPKVRKKKPKTAEKKKSPRKKKVNINLCAAHDLQYAFGLGRQTAVEIVRYRNKHGRFNSIDDVASVPRMGKRNIAKMEGLLEFD